MLGYAFGSIPFGLLLTKVGGHGRCAQQGSGNIGATNVLRTGNKGLAAATLLLDLAKGFVPVLIAWQYFRTMWAGRAGRGDRPLLPGLAQIQGREGRGDPCGRRFRHRAGPLALVYAGVWLGVLAIFRISSLAGMTAVVAAAAAARVSAGSRWRGSLSAIAVLIV